MIVCQPAVLIITVNFIPGFLPRTNVFLSYLTLAFIGIGKHATILSLLVAFYEFFYNIN